MRPRHVVVLVTCGVLAGCDSPERRSLKDDRLPPAGADKARAARGRCGETARDGDFVGASGPTPPACGRG